MKPQNRKFTRPAYNNNSDGGQHRHRNNNGGGGRNASAQRERYTNLAREAMAMGDRILAEYYSQHAEHYYRVMVEEGPKVPPQQQNARPPRHNSQHQQPQQNQPQENGAEPQSGIGNVHFISNNDPMGTNIPAPAMYPGVAQASADAAAAKAPGQEE